MAAVTKERESLTGVVLGWNVFERLGCGSGAFEASSRRPRDVKNASAMASTGLEVDGTSPGWSSILIRPKDVSKFFDPATETTRWRGERDPTELCARNSVLTSTRTRGHAYKGWKDLNTEH